MQFCEKLWARDQQHVGMRGYAVVLIGSVGVNGPGMSVCHVAHLIVKIMKRALIEY